MGRDDKSKHGAIEAPAPHSVRTPPSFPSPNFLSANPSSLFVAENTLASFAKACADGADGIETDIHMTRDNRLVMFHDPELSRTTDGKGKIHSLPWAGVIEYVPVPVRLFDETLIVLCRNVRTLEEPHQPIPLFSDVLELLMKPSNIHVKLNVSSRGHPPRRNANLLRVD